VTVFFTSDLHFNHEGIIRYCNRPWTNVHDMNMGLIDRWNAAVSENDTVWVLGDFGFNAGRHPTLDLVGIFHALAGRKHLVVGNHDEKNPKVLKRLPWDLITPMTTVRDEGRRAMVCHYPMETWKNAARGYLMLHGHSHNTLRTVLPHRFDVGVDVPAWDYSPVSFEELQRLADVQVFSPVDHHGQ
jgi:calcineurin-like phosphoesterase family protein